MHIYLQKAMTMCCELNVTAQQTRRVASTGGGVIRAGALEELGGALHPHCDAVAGTLLHTPMT